MELAPVSATPIFFIHVKTGQIHLRYRVGGRLVDDGRCVPYDDKWTQAHPGYVAESDPDRFCPYCFKKESCR